MSLYQTHVHMLNKPIMNTSLEIDHHEHLMDDDTVTYL